MTGYEPAVRMAQGVAEYCLRGARFFRPDGRFYDPLKGHFHSRSAVALGLLKLGILIGNEGYVQMAERAYKHAKEWGTSFGWFPVDFGNWQRCGDVLHNGHDRVGDRSGHVGGSQVLE